MKKVAVYPGTFDPITFGHIDVINKALKLFDKVIIAASDGANKNYLFNSLERVQLIKKALFVDLIFLEFFGIHGPFCFQVLRYNQLRWLLAPDLSGLFVLHS